MHGFWKGSSRISFMSSGEAFRGMMKKSLLSKPNVTFYALTVIIKHSNRV